jgi:two-component system cell cycle sensor histidine kinase/response regulator CckA
VVSDFAPWSWQLIYHVPRQVLFADLYRFRHNLAAIVSLIFVISMLILYGCMRALTRPIVRLTEASRAIADGRSDELLSVRSRDEIGQLTGSFAQMRTVIQSQLAQLRDQEERLRTTLDAIGDAVVACDMEMRILSMNPIAERLCGWSAEEALGKSVDEVFVLVDAQSRARSVNPAATVIETRSAASAKADSILVAKTGDEFRVTDSGAPIHSDAGVMSGVVMVFRDVSGEYALQEQLNHSQKMDAIGQLAGGIAHDFNNMLGGIMGAAELVKVHLDEGSPNHKFVEVILSASERAADLAAKLLAFARKHPGQDVTVDVHAAIRSAVAMLATTVDRRIVIDLDFQAENCLVTGDETQLQNVMLNLGINAAQAMADGGRLTVRSRGVVLSPAYCRASPFDLSAGEFIEIEVQDTGEGIEPDNIRRIFEPFFTTKPLGKGTGLGLAAAHGTVQQHHGAITVTSELGRGTCFQIVLPICRTEGREGPVEVDLIHGTGCILLADDEEIMRAIAKALLEDLGYEVLLASDGNEAVQCFRRDHDRIDLVILDMVMPGNNGQECFAAMRAINPEVAVLLSSGFTGNDDLDQMRREGLRGFIRKPFSAVSLSHAVAEALTAERDL